MIPNYCCDVCGAHGNKDNLLNLISIETNEHKSYYFCDDCSELVFNKLTDVIGARKSYADVERMVYQRYKARKG